MQNFIIYLDDWEIIQELSDDKIGLLMKSLAEYYINGTEDENILIHVCDKQVKIAYMAIRKLHDYMIPQNS